MTAPVHRGLFLLALRRAAPGPLWLCALVFFALAAARSPSSLPPPAGAEGLAAAFQRQSVWTAFGVVVPAVLVLRAASLARGWRRRDARWIRPTPIAPATVVASALLGSWAAAGLFVLAAALVAEGAVRTPEGGLRLRRALSTSAVVLFEDEGPARASVLEDDVLAPGARLRLRATVAPGAGPAVTARATLTDAAGAVLARVERRIAGPSVLDLVVEREVHGPLLLTLERVGPGAVLVLAARSAELLVPARSPRLASVELGLRAWLALGAWLALAAGLGAWMRPGLAALSTLAVLVGASRWEAWRASVPGVDALAAWRRVGEGLVPTAAGPGDLVGPAVALAVGVLLLRGGLAQRSFEA